MKDLDSWSTGLDEMQREMERFLGHLVGRKRPPTVFSVGIWRPAVDMYVADDEVVVIVELAGVDREAIQLEMEGDLLTLRGERNVSGGASTNTCQLMEIQSGPFARSLKLPFAVDADKAKATYQDGLLQVILPRVAEARATKVKIKT